MDSHDDRRLDLRIEERLQSAFLHAAHQRFVIFLAARQHEIHFRQPFDALPAGRDQCVERHLGTSSGVSNTETLRPTISASLAMRLP
jgi:hypothetical protein